MRLALALSTMILLAFSGCVEDDGAAPPIDEAPDEASYEPGHFAAHYVRHETAVRVAGGYNGLGGSNCINLDDEVDIISGNATISWTDGPVPVDMELFLSSRSEGLIAIASGPSPLHIEFGELHVPSNTVEVMLVWQIADDVPAGAVNDVVGELDLAFDYWGEEPTPDDRWSCSWGH